MQNNSAYSQDNHNDEAKSTLQLTACIDRHVMCKASNYKVEKQMQAMYFDDSQKKGTLQFNAPPIDTQMPMFLKLNATSNDMDNQKMF